MLFIVFDIEIVFLYPWAVTFDAWACSRWSRWLMFMVTVFVAYAYVWRRGGLRLGLEEKLPGGILLSTVEKVAGLRPQGIAVAGHVRAGLLRDRDDGDGRAAVRHRPVRDGAVLGHARGRPI